MSVQVSYPGVYIDEFAPGAPIQGVGTSTAAFIGPAAPSAPILTPTLITSFSAFKKTFGDQPLAGFYLWYAVRGFFENGGQQCYVVRVSNARPATYNLVDRNTPSQTTLVATAKKPGGGGGTISVSVQSTDKLPSQGGASPAIAAASLYAPSISLAGANGTILTAASADDAAKFRPGDVVSISGHTDRARVVSVSGAQLALDAPLPWAAAGASLVLADLAAQDIVLRVVLGQGNLATALTAGAVLRLTKGSGQTAASVYVLVKSVAVEVTQPSNGSAVTTYRVALASGFAGFPSTATGAVTIASEEFTLVVSQGSVTERYERLSMQPSSPRYWGAIVNPASNLIVASLPLVPSSSAMPLDMPKTQTLSAPSGAGQNENLASLAVSDYQDGLDSLVPLPDVNIVAIPDRQDTAVQGALRDHCQGGAAPGTRFAIMDSGLGKLPSGAGSVVTQRDALDSPGGYAALYYPWILVSPAPPAQGTPAPAVAAPPLLVPPSGHVAGIYARTDTRRGVHKAPAGEEATIAGSLGLETLLGDVDQGLLNLPHNVNVLRVFKPGGQPVVWGARTTSTDTTWQYVNIRRLFIYLEQSIQAGIRWAVFEPNNLELWGKLKRTITDFLTKAWRDGALFGETAKDAFYVRIDETLNPPDQLALGRLEIEVGVRPSYPAEFIVVRIGIWEGGSQITEQ